MHACEHECLSTHTAALCLSDCGVVGHYVKFGVEIRLALIIREPQGGRTQAPCRGANTQLFPGSSWQIQQVIPSSRLHRGPSHCTRTTTTTKNIVLHMLAIISPGLAIVLISVTIVLLSFAIVCISSQ